LTREASFRQWPPRPAAARAGAAAGKATRGRRKRKVYIQYPRSGEAFACCSMSAHAAASPALAIDAAQRGAACCSWQH
jgi:hypothetical protein